MNQNKFTPLLMISIAILIGCKSSQKGAVSTAAFYDMGIKYFRYDAASGNEMFQVYAIGSSASDCKKNAKTKVMQALIFNGITQGKNILPILNEAVAVTSFKTHEQEFYKKYLLGNGLLDVEAYIDIDKKLRQSEDKNTALSMQVVVGINIPNFSKEVLNSINKK